MILLVAIVKNEAENLIEWIAHHRVLGVDHFIILDNESSDGSGAILETLDRSGEITAIYWPTRERYPGAFEKNDIGPQAPAYERALAVARAQKRWEWVGFLDLDEFVVLEQEQTLAPFLAGFDEPGAVALNWRMFGSSGLETRAAGFLTAQLTMRARNDWSTHLHVKTFARLDAIRAPGIHLPRMVAGRRIVDTQGNEVDVARIGIHDRIAYGGAWINHYYTRTKADFAKKVGRGRAGNARALTMLDFAYYDRNEVEDLSIARFREPMAREMERLSAKVAASRRWRWLRRWMPSAYAKERARAGPPAPAPHSGDIAAPMATLPSDFDPDAYLRANPDVAADGCDAGLHYLMHGQREGRQLRPA